METQFSPHQFSDKFYHYFVAKINFLVKVKELVEYARERGVQVKLKYLAKADVKKLS